MGIDDGDREDGGASPAEGPDDPNQAIEAASRDERRAHAVEVRDLLARLDALRDEERRTIARELHDELGQAFARIGLELDRAERLRASGLDCGPQHEKLRELLDASLASTQDLLARLRPRILDDFGLVAAVDWLATDTRRRTGLDVRFRAVPAEIELPNEISAGVYRIVQESLTNIIRHAGAKIVAIDLTWNDRVLLVVIADDGVGLPSAPARRTTSMGLLGMHERATAMGGVLELACPESGGTRVTARIPMSL